MMVNFEEAYEAAAARYSEEAWWNLHPTAVVLAILEARKRLDAEAAVMRLCRRRGAFRCDGPERDGKQKLGAQGNSARPESALELLNHSPLE